MEYCRANTRAAQFYSQLQRRCAGLIGGGLIEGEQGQWRIGIVKSDERSGGSRNALVVGELLARGDEGVGVEDLDVLSGAIHGYFGEFLLHSELVELHGVAEVGDECGGVELLDFEAVVLHVELADESVSPLVDEVDELGVAAGEDGLVVDGGQGFGVGVELVLVEFVEGGGAVDSEGLVFEGAYEVIQQVGRREALALDLDSFAHLQRHLRLIERQRHDLVGVVHEVQHRLAVQGEQGGDFGMLVVAAGVLLEYLFVEEVVDEDVAAFVGDEQVFAQDLHVVDFGADVEGFGQGEVAVVVEVYHFRAGVERDELLVAQTVQARVRVFGLHVFVVAYGFLLELGDGGLEVLDGGDAGFGGVAEFLDDGADLVFLFEEEGDVVAVDAELVDGAVAVVDGVGEGVVELLVEFVVGVDGAGGEVEVGEGLLEELAVLLVGDGAPYFAAEFVQVAFADVEHAHQFLLEDLELAELVQPLLAGLVRGRLELDPLLHQLVHLLVQQRHLDHLAVPRQVLRRAARTHQDVLLLEALHARADFVRLHVVLAADFASQDLHSDSNPQIKLIPLPTPPPPPPTTHSHPPPTTPPNTHIAGQHQRSTKLSMPYHYPAPLHHSTTSLTSFRFARRSTQSSVAFKTNLQRSHNRLELSSDLRQRCKGTLGEIGKLRTVEFANTRH